MSIVVWRLLARVTRVLIPELVLVEAHPSDLIEDAAVQRISLGLKLLEQHLAHWLCVHIWRVISLRLLVDVLITDDKLVRVVSGCLSLVG